jgi:DNA-binding transcriptional LysR family regulator
MEITQLRYFVAVAEGGSFSRAAHALEVSQPSLSQAVARLEAEFGTELFRRGSRGVVLTADGEALLGRARDVLASVGQTQGTVDSLHALTAGRLGVSALHSLATTAAEVVACFIGQHPAVLVSMGVPEHDETLYGDVSSGVFDAAFVRVLPHGDDVEVTPLGTEESVALVPRASVLGSSSAPITLAELVTLPLIVSPPGSRTRSMFDDLFATSGVTYRIAAESEHHETCIELVRGEVGAHLTTRGGLPDGLDELVTVRALSPRREWPVGLVTRSQRPAPAVQAFRDVARAHFAARGRQ